jgi:xylose isomerase
MLKLSIITLFLGQTKNRFLVYQDPADHRHGARTAPVQRRASSAVELRYPADFGGPCRAPEGGPEVATGFRRVGDQLRLGAQRSLAARGMDGGIGRLTDRREAVDDAKRAMDIAAELGAGRLHNCPLNDGIDYPFELDPIRALDNAAGCFEQICAHDRAINVCIEYKISEPRVRCLIGTAGETIAFAQMVGADNLGATLDSGHCFLANENPAQAAAMLAKCKRLFYVHINDNDGRGDWDLTPGTWHTWEFVELFHTLKRLGYDDWIAFDIVPKEHEPSQVFTEAAAIANKLKALADRIDADEHAGADGGAASDLDDAPAPRPAVTGGRPMTDLARMADAIRFLAIDAIIHAGDGHPGAPLGGAEIVTTLYNRHLKFDVTDPTWPDRDRFVQSNGHGSMLIYAANHLAGFEKLSLDAIKAFRRLGSDCPGHPEIDPQAGIETTTGPLGQGIANAVGMAVAEEKLRARFGPALCDHYTYALVGDGCLMEGIAAEVPSQLQGTCNWGG